MIEGDFSPELKQSITNAFNEGLRQLIVSVHGIMPDESIVTNVIASLFIARKQCGFTEEETVSEIVKAVNKNSVWANEIKKFGREN